MNDETSNIQLNKKTFSKVKISKDLFKRISREILNTLKVDTYTKKIIDQKIIQDGNCSYIGLIRKHASFFSMVRLMVLVDYVDPYKAFKYYLNDFGTEKYDKNVSKDYSLVSRLHEAELKLIMLEELFEMFESSSELGVIFHEPLEKVDAVVELKESLKLNLSDNEGYIYIKNLKPGKYGFESRSCCSISGIDYILNNEKRKGHLENFDKYFLFIPRNTFINDEILKELENNKIKLLFSNFTTIDIVNDVAYMEGILRRKY